MRPEICEIGELDLDSEECSEEATHAARELPGDEWIPVCEDHAREAFHYDHDVTAAGPGEIA